MNTECLYVLYDGGIDKAKEICRELKKAATELNHELYPSYIGKAVKDFCAHGDYDGESECFEVKEGQIIVFAYGKLHSMFELWPDEARIAFPYKLNPEYYPYRVGELVKDLYKYVDETDDFVKCV